MQYLTFSAIAKRCPNGTWLDEKSGDCVSHDEWYKRNTKNGQQNANGEKPKKCPKGTWKDEKTGECVSHEEWYKRNYKNYKPKSETDTDSKEEKNPEIEPYDKGITKPESLKYVMGVTRKAILKEHPEYFEQVENTAKSVRDKLSDDSIWSDDSHTTAWKIKETLAPFDEYGGIEVSDNLKNIPIPVIKSILNDFVDTFEEYPYAMASFGGFTTVNENSDCLMWCSYNQDRQIGIKVSDYASMEQANDDYEGIAKLRDPIAGGERTDWGFHFKGSTGHSSISHEWGHACDIALFSLKVNCLKGNKVQPRSLYDNSALDNLEWGTKTGNEIRSEFKEKGYSFFASVRYGKGYAEANLSYESEEKYNIEEVKDILKKYGCNIRNIDKKGGYVSFEIIPIDNPKLNLDKLEYSDRKHLRKKSRIESLQQKSLWKEFHNLAKQRVKDCEELYKELYNVEILPTECYTRYGYYGEGRASYEYRSGKKANITESASQERLAEAMEDVMVRKDKANSMSQILVAHLEYEYYQLVTGDYDKTFKDFIKNDVGYDVFKDRIIKGMDMRYINFNSIAKRCPNGKRFDDETQTCIPKEEWEAKHHHDYSKKPKQEQPKRKMDIANQSFVKVKAGTPEYKMIKNLKVGDSDEAKATRKAVIDFYNKKGWIPKIDVTPFKVNGTTFDGNKTTYTMFTTEDGKYTPERQEVHKEVLKKIMERLPKPPKGRKPIVLFTGGGSASGKGSMDGTLAKKMGININIKPQKEGESDEDYRKRVSNTYDKVLGPYKIDPDAIMELIPEYEEYVKHDMIGGASVFHKEASDIAKMVFDMAINGGYDIIYDGTFSSQKAVKMAKKIDRKKYDTHLIGKLTDVDICKQRSGKRFINGGKFPRIVPNKVLESSNNGFRDILKNSDVDAIFDTVTTIEDSENKK